MQPVEQAAHQPKEEAPHGIAHFANVIGEVLEAVDAARKGRVSHAESVMNDLACEECFMTTVVQILAGAVPFEAVVEYATAHLRENIRECSL